MEIRTCRTVYEPEEDSLLLQECLEAMDLNDARVLDMGCGSGILSLTAAGKGAQVTSADINPDAVRCTKQNAGRNDLAVKAVHSDLFEQIDQKFDLIICNSPYLPEDAHEVHDALTTAISGGPGGHEWCVRFLEKAQEYLLPGGQILLLFSTLSQPKKILAVADDRLYEYAPIAEKKVFFETLLVYRFRRNAQCERLYGLNIKNIRFCARGMRGMVYQGWWKGVKVACKMKNPKSVAPHAVKREAKYLGQLNPHGIGPTLYFAEDDVVVRAFVDGVRIKDFLAEADAAIPVVEEIFRQCRLMDTLGIEKQEMKNPYKHILVTDNHEVVMIDFERCRESSKPGNVTQLIQWITSDEMQEMLAPYGLKYDVSVLRSLARTYKHDQSKENFQKIKDHIF
ncbi:MAG: HemK2/MTQ2 family protein methyltransferase [Nanoarchaeota archaeon]